MAVSTFIDITNEFNAGSGYIFDVGGADYVVVQLVSPSGAVTFNTTNDAAAVQGVSDGTATSATNFSVVQGTNLATGTGVTTLNATGSVRFGYIGRFLQLTGTSVSATKVLLYTYRVC